MGTRSLILKPHGDGFLGRYCHWDGYPDGVGQTLINIVRRDGVEKARKVLIDDHHYWSSIDDSMVINLYKGGDSHERDLSSYPPGTMIESLSYPGEQCGMVRASYVVGYGEADLNCPKGDGSDRDDDWVVTPENYGQWGWCEWVYLLADAGLWYTTYNEADEQPRWDNQINWSNNIPVTV